MEIMHKNVIINRPGGNASKGAVRYVIQIPSDWGQAIGLSPDDRTVQLAFDGEQIIISKIK